MSPAYPSTVVDYVVLAMLLPVAAVLHALSSLLSSCLAKAGR